MNILLESALIFVGTAAAAYGFGRAFARRGWWRAVAAGRGLAVGAALAAMTLAVVVLLPHEQRRGTLAFTLVGTAAVYVGFALVDGRASRLAIEVLWAIVIVGTALLGFWTAPAWLAVGFIAHGVWDVIHHPIRLIDTRSVPGWYPPVCLIYDLPVGFAALLLI